MAAILRSQFSSVLRLTSAVHMNTTIRCKSHKKTPKWRDPDDISWMQPLFEREMEQKAQGDKNDKPPAMLHMVMRIRKLNGRPYWEKETIKLLGLEEKFYKPVIHKNTPEMNKMLQSVKHLLRIVPISFPHGLPSCESDLHHCFLRHDGQFTFRKSLLPLESNFVEPDESSDDVWKMDNETVNKSCEKILTDFRLSTSFFPAKYVYKYNQDGKEYRYFGDQNICSNRDWY